MGLSSALLFCALSACGVDDAYAGRTIDPEVVIRWYNSSVMKMSVANQPRICMVPSEPIIAMLSPRELALSLDDQQV